MTHHDPFEDLAAPVEARPPRPSFARSLRARLLDALDIDDDRPPTVQLPERKAPMPENTSASPPTTTSTTGRRPDGIWAPVTYTDARAGIRFLVDVLGFEEQLVVAAPDDESMIVHSQIRWPEGGLVQVNTYDPDNPFLQSRPPGAQSLYVVTSDPRSVWERCQAAGADVLRQPESTDYDPDGLAFSIRDPEGNIWSFGTYAGGA